MGGAECDPTSRVFADDADEVNGGITPCGGVAECKGGPCSGVGELALVGREIGVREGQPAASQDCVNQMAFVEQFSGEGSTDEPGCPGQQKSHFSRTLGA